MPRGEAVPLRMELEDDGARTGGRAVEAAGDQGLGPRRGDVDEARGELGLGAGDSIWATIVGEPISVNPPAGAAASR